MTGLDKGQESSDGQVPAAPSGPPATVLISAMTVVVRVPATLEVRVVDASRLGEYERWAGVAGAALSLFSGFLVATIQDWSTPRAGPLAVAALLMLVLFTFASWTARGERKRMLANTQLIHYRPYGEGDA